MEELTEKETKELLKLKNLEEDKQKVLEEYKKLNEEYNKNLKKEKWLKVRLESQARRLNDLSGKLYNEYGICV